LCLGAVQGVMMEMGWVLCASLQRKEVYDACCNYYKVMNARSA